MTRRKLPIAALAATLVLPAAAAAHISIHPNTVPAGAFATLDLRVPGEQEGAHVTQVDVRFPGGFTSIEYQNVPGWSTHVIEEKVNPPIQTDAGPVSEQVSQVLWSWNGPLGMVDNNQFVEFPISVAVPNDLVGRALQFKTVQTYSNGQIVHWIDDSLGAEHPAPRINVTAPGGAIEDVAGKEAGPEAQPTGSGHPAGAQPTTSSTASKGLGIAALVAGILGLIAGVGALALVMRTRGRA